MRTQKTVLILGAGASYQFGLPLGIDLKSTIADDLRIMFDEFGRGLKSGCPHIVEALRILTRNPDTGERGDINPHRAVAVRISQAMRPSGSIDEYVERHRNDPKYAECAKLAIAKAILEGERNSTLHSDYFDEDDFVGENAETWLSMMLRDLTKRLTSDSIINAFDNLFVVNFNYDRCFEHFTFLWLKQMYGFADQEAGEICSRIAIYHPYGKLADLPFENPSQNAAFGGKITGEKLIRLSRNIRTYSESVADEKSLTLVHAAVAEAKKLVFLGFGFHEPNLEILSSPKASERSSLRCYATSMGIPLPRLELDKANISSHFRINQSGLFFEHVPDSCEEFWRQYGDVIVV